MKNILREPAGPLLICLVAFIMFQAFRPVPDKRMKRAISAVRIELRESRVVHGKEKVLVDGSSFTSI